MGKQKKEKTKTQPKNEVITGSVSFWERLRYGSKLRFLTTIWFVLILGVLVVAGGYYIYKYRQGKEHEQAEVIAKDLDATFEQERQAAPTIPDQDRAALLQEDLQAEGLEEGDRLNLLIELAYQLDAEGKTEEAAKTAAEALALLPDDEITKEYFAGAIERLEAIKAKGSVQ